MCPKVLIIEDEPAIADTIVYALKTEGFEPQWCATGEAGLAALSRQNFSIVILDIGLPDGSGFEFCKVIRSRSTVPVLFLTARSGELDRVVGLEIGGDDYLVKPFSPRELTARVRAILRRTLIPPGEPLLRLAAPVPGKTEIRENKPSVGAAVAIDEVRCRASFHGVSLELTRYEFRLLKALAGQPGRVFTREQLMEAAWEEPSASLDRTVDAHVKTLRSKLRAIRPAEDPIQTHRGLGYSLRE